MTSILPPQWKKGGLIYGTGLSLATAKKMLEAAEKRGEELGVPMTVAIADSGGNLIGLIRMDNAMLCSIQIAQDKAYTAVFKKDAFQSCGRTL